jgi:hypothetical protein
MKEVFWPFLYESPKDDEVYKIGVEIGHRIRALEVVVKMVQFFDNELLYVILIV